MSDSPITPIVMPKWGLSMSEGRVVEWTVEEGTDLKIGDEILDVETDKIAGSVEATDVGHLRRIVAQADTVYPVGGLLAVLADASVPDADIDRYIEEFNASFTPVTADAEDAGPAYQFIEAGGRRLRYTRQGESGQTVLLIHGFGGDLDNWLFNIQALAEKHTVYALDLPGHGQSDKTLDDPSLAGLAAGVLAFMDTVGIERAHLVGHSLGGAIALQLARDMPERVQSLALIGSAGLGAERSAARINRGYIDGFVAANSRRELKPHAQQLFADPKLVTRQLLEDLLKFKRLDGVDQALRSLADGLFDGDRQRSLPGEGFDPAGKPLLVIWGKEDKIIPASHAEQAPAGATVEIIDGAGHMVQMEAANRVNALLLGHLG